MITIKRYSNEFFSEWNIFIKESKNGFFLFDRNYMDYHSSRFTDHSLFFYKHDELLSVLPASQIDNVLYSHGGLTYGGFILSKRAGVNFLMDLFAELKLYFKSNRIATFIYKPIPYIFHRLPSQEDLYVLFRHNAMLYRRDISSVIDLSKKPTYTKGTKYNLSKARRNKLRIERSYDFKLFMDIEEEILRSKYNTRPTHSTFEISSLAEKFPDNIKLYLVFNEIFCLGGSIIYETDTVAHTQYIGITDKGKEVGVLDALTDFLIQIYSQSHKYFSFGISTENDGKYLNEGLIKNKESFGARAIVNDFYKIDIL